MNLTIGKRLRGSRLRAVGIILSGGVLSQVAAVAALPLVSRIYTDTQFGYLSLVAGISGTLIPIATLRFETAAMIPEDVLEVRALAWSGFLASIGVVLLTFSAIGTLHYFRGSQTQLTWELAAWVAVSIAAGAAYSIFSQLALRNKLYGLVAKRNLVRSLAMVGTQIGLGLAWPSKHALVLGNFVGSIAGTASVYKQCKDLFRFPGFSAMRAAWRAYWRFPAVFTPSALLNSLGLFVPVLFFNFHFGLDVGGQVGMAERLVAVPLSLVAAAVGQVIDSEVSRDLQSDPRSVLRSYVTTSVALGCLGLVVSGVFGLLGPWLVVLVLGQHWAVAGAVVQGLALMAGLRLVASPMSKYLLLMQKAGVTILLDFMRVVLLVISVMLVVSLELSVISAVWLVYSGLSISYLASWIFGYRSVAALAERVAPSTLAHAAKERN